MCHQVGEWSPDQTARLGRRGSWEKDRLSFVGMCRAGVEQKRPPTTCGRTCVCVSRQLSSGRASCQPLATLKKLIPFCAQAEPPAIPSGVGAGTRCLRGVRDGRGSGPPSPGRSASHALGHRGGGAATSFMSRCHRHRWVTELIQGPIKLLSCKILQPLL